MIIGISGRLGRGKTLTMTHLAHTLPSIVKNNYTVGSDAYTVIANYDTVYSDVRADSIREIEDAANEAAGGLALLDELWTLADSREAQSNKRATEFIKNVRKAGLGVVYTTQRQKDSDVRIRTLADLYIMPEFIDFYEHGYNHRDDLVKINWVDAVTLRPVRAYKIRANYYYDKYSTEEQVSYENKAAEYENMIEKGVQAYKEQDMQYKKDIKAYLITEQGVSKADADIAATRAMQQLRQGEQGTEDSKEEKEESGGQQARLSS